MDSSSDKLDVQHFPTHGSHVNAFSPMKPSPGVHIRARLVGPCVCVWAMYPIQSRKSSRSCYVVLKGRSYHVCVCLHYLTPSVGPCVCVWVVYHIQSRKSSRPCYVVLKGRSHHVYVCLHYLTPTVGYLLEFFFRIMSIPFRSRTHVYNDFEGCKLIHMIPNII